MSYKIYHLSHIDLDGYGCQMVTNHYFDNIEFFKISDVVSNSVTINGAVNRPGEYDLDEGLTITLEKPSMFLLKRI